MFLRKYVGYYAPEWNLYTFALTFAYNWQPKISTGILKFDSDLSVLIKPLLKDVYIPEPSATPKEYKYSGQNF